MNSRSIARVEIAVAGLGIPSKGSPETIRDLAVLYARNTLLEQNEKATTPADDLWSSVFSQSITGALKSEALTPVRIVGWIGAISPPLPLVLTFGDSNRDAKGLIVTIVDADGQELESLAAPVDGFRSDLYQIQRENRRVVFSGLVVPVNRKKGPENRFFVWDVITHWTAEDLLSLDVNADVSKLNDTYGKLIRKEHGLFNYIKQQLVSGLSISGLRNLEGLDKCIDVMIYQSLSDGMNASPRYSNRIHTLVIGPPGQGKGFLSEIAAILNPVSRQVTTLGTKVTAAGLIANVSTRAGRKISQPGLLPLASGGVLTFQDFHQLEGGGTGVLAALSEAMETGAVTDSTSSKSQHETVTAIHVDMNRVSDVKDNVLKGSFADLGIPYNVISRFDYIIELPPKLEQLLASLRKKFSGGTTLSSYPQLEAENLWRRDLKRLIAYQRTIWREVEIPPDVNRYIFERVERAFGLTKSSETTVSKKFTRDNIHRVSRSVLKFVKAITCGDHNPIASKEDVDRAFTYVEEKIKFLGTLTEDEPHRPGNPRVEEMVRRQERILAQIKKRQFTTADYVGAMGPFANGIQERSARQAATRDLTRLRGKTVTKLRQGVWEKIGKESSRRTKKGAPNGPKRQNPKRKP